MSRNNPPINVYALKTALPYLILGGLWILLSDRLLGRFVDDVATLTALQTYKGWFFVTASAVLVYVTSRHHFNRIMNTTGRLIESEQALSESQRAMLRLTQNLPGMVYRCRQDADRTLEFVSDGCYGLTGYAPRELVGNSVASFGQCIVEEDRETVAAQIRNGIETQTPFQVQYRILSHDGTVRWVWEFGWPVTTSQSDEAWLEGYVVDISEQKRLEEQDRTSERLRLIGQAASSIVHDLRNPLHAILGHVELTRSEKLPPEMHGHLDIIEGQVDNMMSMIRELLEYARGEMSLQPAPADITTLCRQIVDAYQPTFAKANVELTYTTICEPGAITAMIVDKEKVTRALTNLISNAKEALVSGGRIQLRSWVARDQVRLEIQDNGPGIKDEIRDTLFEPFVTRGKSGGTGLGLAITRRIVEAHGGTISFSSTLGIGTTFVVTLPRNSVSGSPVKPVAAVVRV